MSGQYDDLLALMATSDFVHWRNVTPAGLTPGSRVDDLFFIDDLHGWLATWDCGSIVGRLYRTSDAGRTWVALPQTFDHSCNAGATNQLDFLDRSNGFLVKMEPTGPGASLYRTNDGGRTWPNLDASHSGIALPEVGAVGFWSLQHGWQAPLYPTDGYATTRDGGTTWSNSVLPVPATLGDAKLLAGLPTYFGGGSAVMPATIITGQQATFTLYSSRDGGRTWAARALVPQTSSCGPDCEERLPQAHAGSAIWWVATQAHSAFGSVQIRGRGGGLSSRPQRSMTVH